MNKWIQAMAALMLLSVVGCATVERDENRLDDFHAAQPKSLLVVPVVNNSTDVQAPTSVLATLPFRLGEKGYYVYPVNTVKTLLEFEGYYEPAEVHAQPPEQLAELFKADAILYVTVHEWTSRYVLVSTTTEVDFEYRIVNADGAELWSARKVLQYSPQGNSSGNPLADLIASAVTAAIERAAPNYLPLTRQAHNEVFNGHYVGLPPGPYSPAYEEYYQQLNNPE
ncbi:hypothetical protein EDC38_0383 [Marinimicrobium koreense]|uniref:Lipoprotein n=1 Tax=Marinimicrobium koreense TaxID=306545 RepID=A0A3N1NUC7_9GAMM|nr:GNA1162 family protein [Marinimicrobium koreense]ROQ19795.1 hypothetical protein EDC38_0383 [Marinimicrobium koreense]